MTSLHVLIVEDETLHQAITTRLLVAAGHLATVAGNGQQMLDTLEAEAFDLILLDLDMPVLDGLSALRQAQDRWPGRLPPVVVVSSTPLEDSTPSATAAGAAMVFQKPFSREKLAAITASLSLDARS